MNSRPLPVKRRATRAAAAEAALARSQAGDPAGGREAVRAPRLPRGDDPPDRRGSRRAAGAGGLLLRPEARALPRHLRALGPLDRGTPRRPARGRQRPGRPAHPAAHHRRPSSARCWPCAPAPKASTTRCWWRASCTTRPRRPTACCAATSTPGRGLHRRPARRAATCHARRSRLGLPVRARRPLAPPERQPHRTAVARREPPRRSGGGADAGALHRRRPARRAATAPDPEQENPPQETEHE